MDIRVGIVQEFTIARTSTPGYLWKVFGFVRQHPSKSLLLMGCHPVLGGCLDGSYANAFLLSFLH